MLPVHRRPVSGGGLPPVLVFDFDGVLCDSLEECMMPSREAERFGQADERYSLRTKPPALDAIATRERRARADVVLIDDSVENGIAACGAGFSVRWASWGYHAPEDADTATRCGIPALTVEGLLKVTLSEAAVRP